MLAEGIIWIRLWVLGRSYVFHYAVVKRPIRFSLIFSPHRLQIISYTTPLLLQPLPFTIIGHTSHVAGLLLTHSFWSNGLDLQKVWAKVFPGVKRYVDDMSTLARTKEEAIRNCELFINCCNIKPIFLFIS